MKGGAVCAIIFAILVYISIVVWIVMPELEGLIIQFVMGMLQLKMRKAVQKNDTRYLHKRFLYSPHYCHT